MTNPESINKISIDVSNNIQNALKQMDEIDGKLLVVMDDKKFKSLVSIGDIQRAILNGYKLETLYLKFYRKNIKVANSNDSFEDIKVLMRKFRMEFIPVIGSNNHLEEVIFWEDVINDDEKHLVSKFNIPVIIMAGGKGTRLKPITNIIPKPLIPIGEKPILEWIINSFNDVGVEDFYLTVNYKQEMIRSYFDGLPDKNI